MEKISVAIGSIPSSISVIGLIRETG